MTLKCPNKKGDHAELLAAAWLLEQGYEVFRNVSSVGPIDLVAVSKEETILADVKTCRQTVDFDVPSLYASPLNKSAKGFDVRRLFVFKGHISWKIADLHQFMDVE